MTDGADEKIAELLRSDAPAERDAVFRLSVMERREQKRFRNWSLLVLAVGLALGVVSLIGVSVGGQALDAAGVIVVVGLAAAGYFFYAPHVLHILRRFRS
jgi:hypothetical protein